MLVSDFRFHLPPERIAQHPPAERDGARMLTLDRRTGAYADRTFRDLPSLLRPGDLVILNNSRVIPARLFARRAGLRTQSNTPAPTGTIEVLLTAQLNATDWRTLVKPGRKVPVGETLLFYAEPTGRREIPGAPPFAVPSQRVGSDAATHPSALPPVTTPNSVILSEAKDLTAQPAATSAGQPAQPDSVTATQSAANAKDPLPQPASAKREPVLTATVIAAGDRGERTLRFAPVPDFFAALDALGHIPLPPYLHRADTPADRARYQTVYAAPDTHGSTAAPTAGLHFTPEILDSIRARGATIEYVTLHVGLGTFQPVQVSNLDDIRLHAETYTLPASTAAAINAARREGRRIVAVGTTTVRTLEHCAREAMATSLTTQSSQPASEPQNSAQRVSEPENSAPHTTPLSTFNFPLSTPQDWQLHPHTGQTSIFLRPGDRFHLVDALLTNFHLPESTLLMLVSAFAAQPTTPQQGIEHTLNAYHHAVTQHYRFFSYGDCMFLS